MSISVEVQYATERTGVPSQQEFVVWVRAALAGRRDKGEVVVRVVDEPEIAELNSRYRGKKGPTNVLSFPFAPPAAVATGHLGDLIVCAPVVLKESIEQTKDEQAHWAHMVVHGVLHLLGFQHETDREAEEMEALEVAVLKGLGFPDPYA